MPENQPQTEPVPQVVGGSPLWVIALSMGPSPPSGVDAQGRLLPISEDERRARVEMAARGMEEIARITDEDDTDEAWADFMKGLDAGRPDRKLFEGQYYGNRSAGRSDLPSPADQRKV